MRQFLAMLLLTLLAGLMPAQAQTLDLAQVDQEVDRIFSRARTIGGSLVIMKDGQVVYERDYGLRSVNSKLPVDERTYFKMGCVTKLVSALAILQLVDEGLVELDADISQYFGYTIRNPYYPRTPSPSGS